MGRREMHLAFSWESQKKRYHHEEEDNIKMNHRMIGCCGLD
jgi:hypothetical protein